MRIFLKITVFVLETKRGFLAEIPVVCGQYAEGKTWEELRQQVKRIVENCYLTIPAKYVPPDGWREEEIILEN